MSRISTRPFFWLVQQNETEPGLLIAHRLGISYNVASLHFNSMRDRSRIGKNYLQDFFPDQRATAALRALSCRCFAVSFRALALPPFSPPSRPSATAAAFFFTFAMPGISHISASP